MQKKQPFAGENANIVGYWENTIGKTKKMSYHVSPVHRSGCLFSLVLQTGWWNRWSSALSLCPYILSLSKFSSCTTEWLRNLRIKTLSLENLFSKIFPTQFFPVYTCPWCFCRSSQCADAAFICGVQAFIKCYIKVCKHLLSVIFIKYYIK